MKAERTHATRPLSLLGIFGGSFDPPHVAHTILAAYVLSAYPLDRLLVIPTFRHVFAKPLAPYDHRIRMCKLAMADIKRVEVSRIEEQIGGDSLTLKTVEELMRRFPGVGLRLVIGSDLLAETSRWYSFERISELAPPIIVPRAGYAEQTPSGPQLPLISSSDIRRKVQRGISTEGLLSHAVAQYVQRYHLYKYKNSALD
jgi:nicotinate-nucleotide adenylyltransferase